MIVICSYDSLSTWSFGILIDDIFSNLAVVSMMDAPYSMLQFAP
jgi:hypothetical protein